jgi:hypothetical protein
MSYRGNASTYVMELAEILALDFGAEEGIPELKGSWRRRDQQEAVLYTCSSLIVVVGDGDYGVVQFSHFSVKEFLTSDRLAMSYADISRFHILPELAHTVVAKACLGILLRSEPYSFLVVYATRFWMDHTRVEKVWTHVEDGIRCLFDPARPYLKAWLSASRVMVRDSLPVIISMNITDQPYTMLHCADCVIWQHISSLRILSTSLVHLDDTLPQWRQPCTADT